MTQAVIPNLTVPIEAIADFCQRWNITEFALFGSVLRADFRPDSDVDVLITVREGYRLTFSKLAAMEDELERLFGCSVDLLTRRSIEDSPNYLRRKSILASAQVIYAER